MPGPPFKCLFCLDDKASFTRVEHPIPESLGNDDCCLPPGCVCDACNEYFGAKVENRVINAPPFSIERLQAAVRTKKGSLPRFKRGDGFDLLATGWYQSVGGVFPPGSIRTLPTGQRLLLVPPGPQDDKYLVRFLLKVGLELLLVGETGADPYAPEYDAARTVSRFGTPGRTWEYAYGQYPRQSDLIVAERQDELSPIITHQLYQYTIGRLPAGEVGICFVYRTHIYACMLNTSSVRRYAASFNSMNEIQLRTFTVTF